MAFPTDLDVRPYICNEAASDTPRRVSALVLRVWTSGRTETGISENDRTEVMLAECRKEGVAPKMVIFP